MRVIRVSGTIRKSMEEAIRRARKDIQKIGRVSVIRGGEVRQDYGLGGEDRSEDEDEDMGEPWESGEGEEEGKDDDDDSGSDES
jgi:hypothetical protein